MYRYTAFITLLFILSGLLVSCKGDSQFKNIESPAVEMDIYNDPDNTYSIEYPKEWGYEEGRVNFFTQRRTEGGQTASMVNIISGTPSELGYNMDIKHCVNKIVSVIRQVCGHTKAVTFKGHDAFECVYRYEEGPYQYHIRFVVFTDEYVCDIVGMFADTDDQKLGEYIISSLEIK